MKRTGGFTLIEMLVVIVMVSVLATLMLVFLNAAREKGRDAKRVSDMGEIAKALELYYLDYGTYPQTSQPEIIGDEEGEIETALEAYMSGPAPRDPVNDDRYQYRYNPSQCVSKDDPCGPSSCGTTGAVIGFTRAEHESFVSRQDTCHGELWDAAFNKAFIP